MTPPAPDEVHVWYRFTDGISDEEVEQQLTAELSPDEQARARRFMFARDRRDFTVAHALLRRTLSRYGDRQPIDWTFDAPEHLGKPAIAGANPGQLEFNLSHTHGLVACAVARGVPVGVDVELVARSISEREIAERFFSPIECDGLDAVAGQYSQRFIELWTLKEAYLKGIGKGLSHPLNNFSFHFEDPDSVAFTAPPGVRTAEWQFLLAAPAPPYRLAVTVQRENPEIRYRIHLHDAADPNRTATILRHSAR